jgi:PEP-CTERM motif
VTAGSGMQRLWDVLLAEGVDPAAGGWTVLTEALAVSLDGNTIVGYGTRNGNTEAFIAVVPEPATGVLFGVALGGIAVASRRRGRRNVMTVLEVSEQRRVLSFTPAASVPVSGTPQCVVTVGGASFVSLNIR